MKQINSELSQSLHRWAVPKQCWRNAILCLTCLPKETLRAHQFYYVEGFLLSGGLVPLEHGWLETDTEIIDPTLLDERAEDYYSGVLYPARDILKMVRQSWTWIDLPLVHDGRGAKRFRTGGHWGHQNPAYRAAYEAAFNKAFGPLQQNHR